MYHLVQLSTSALYAFKGKNKGKFGTPQQYNQVDLPMSAAVFTAKVSA